MPMELMRRMTTTTATNMIVTNKIFKQTDKDCDVQKPAWEAMIRIKVEDRIHLTTTTTISTT
jgi:hypothetical protein